ncbi:MAG: nuclear transport factor 2 family protein [Erythrobacter sp.]|uniref:nuclear transport factor 2 family protein n=1 Tax=Erythrobacter sp. TaxID=1042 RepID=UPI0026167434|nr:nuclear transport factor 2 family protein [Erythrobacter sp.]MDJ0977100.1 nuclear transport factor 2 family protein [Erythrobacter sp.]
MRNYAGRLRRARLGLAFFAVCLAHPSLSAQPAPEAQDTPDAEAAPSPDPASNAEAEPAVFQKPEVQAAAKVIQGSLDAWRAGNFEGWIKSFSPDVLVVSDQMRIVGRKELRAIYRFLFDSGVPEPQILESGWTGQRVYVRQQEFIAKGTPSAITYAEYEVKDGLITAVYAQMD